MTENQEEEKKNKREKGIQIGNLNFEEIMKI